MELRRLAQSHNFCQPLPENILRKTTNTMSNDVLHRLHIAFPDVINLILWLEIFTLQSILVISYALAMAIIVVYLYVCDGHIASHTNRYDWQYKADDINTRLTVDVSSIATRRYLFCIYRKTSSIRRTKSLIVSLLVLQSPIPLKLSVESIMKWSTIL